MEGTLQKNTARDKLVAFTVQMVLLWDLGIHDSTFIKSDYNSVDILIADSFLCVLYKRPVYTKQTIMN